ncbi:hypothetical protein [Streptomyces sp. NPDC048669]|uniref:hypothetical protein n=1 Tax=Streptomyces sp. NPDC048669 TaxID=3155267 RepID=UPI0034231803
MKLVQIVKRAAGHYTARTATGTFTIDRIGRTWHLIGRRVAAAYRTLRAAVAALTALRPTTPVGGMSVRLTKLIARTHRAARTTSKALAYRTRSGLVAAAVEQGHLIRTGDLLERLGADLPDGQASWYGRHCAKAYRAANLGTNPVRVWAQHRTTGRWIHVNVFEPTDAALYTALTTYKATRHLGQADFMEVA